MQVVGQQFIAGARVPSAGTQFFSIDATTGESLPHVFQSATATEVAKAAVAAAAAYPEYRQRPLSDRADLLDTIATEIDALNDDFIKIVMRETGLPEARIHGERARTTGQLRLFASVVRRGDFLGARIDTALPRRHPIPRPDIRQYRIAIGPVAVFGSGNFPLAFSVSGGDTASALAAGCPVVVKAHPGHPITSELVAQTVVASIEKCQLPYGTFNMIYGDKIGSELIKAPEIKAVGFTGSPTGGRALCDIAAGRPEPIPVFAEMSSTNPVIVMPGALAERGEQIAQELADSVNLGAGQFCTNPGIIIGFKGEAFDGFNQQFATALSGREPAVMLNTATLKNYLAGVKRLQQSANIGVLLAGQKAGTRAKSCAFTAAASLLHHKENPLDREVFGPCSVLVEVNNFEQLSKLIPTLKGQLTASLLAANSDLKMCSELIPALEERVGRLILNGYPTGLEVCDAIVHGGPYPATSDSRGTSVGTLAIDRFLRPVCYQDYPEQMLPEALQNSNPLKLRRLVNGRWSDQKITEQPGYKNIDPENKSNGA